MSIGRKSKSERNALNSQQIFNKNVGIYFQTIIFELSKSKEIRTENAADLLKEIVIERKKLGKKGKDFSPISLKEIPFEIPKNWIWCRLGEILHVVSGNNFESSSFTNREGIKVIKITNTGVGKLIETEDFLPFDFEEKYNNFLVYSGELLIALTRPYIADGLKICLCSDAYDKSLLNQRVALLRTGRSKEENLYIYFFMRTDYILNFFKSKYDGKSQQPNLKIEDILSLLIPLPPLSEQNKIVEFLSNFESEKDGVRDYFFNEQIENKIIQLHESQLTGSELQTELKTQANLLSKLRQAYLQEAVMGKLTEPSQDDAKTLLADIKSQKAQLIKQGKLRKEKPLPPIKPEEIPFKIPDNWVWCRLGEICDTITKGSSPKWQGVQYVDSPEKGILFITSKNVDSFTIDLSNVTYVESKFNDIEPRSVLKKGDLLTNIVGASIGRTALYDLDFIANINQAVCILRIEHEFINKSYLLNLLNSSFVINQMFESQFAPGRANLSMGDIATFPIPLPPLSEQKAIVEKVEGLLVTVSLLEEENKIQQKEVQRLMGAVLQEAFGGR